MNAPTISSDAHVRPNAPSSLSEFAPVPLCEVDAAGQLLDANRAFHQRFPEGPPASIAAALPRILHTDRHSTVITGGPSGPDLQVDIAAVPGSAPNADAADRFIVAFTDLPKQQPTGGALRQAEQQLRLAIKATDLGMWEFDPHTRIASLTPRGCSILGLPAETAVTEEQWLNLIHQDDRERTLTSLAEALAENSSGQFSATYRVIHATGDLRWIRSSGVVTPSEEFPGNVRLIGTLLDITEHKRIEEEAHVSGAHFRFLTEAIPALVWMCGADKRATYMNNAWLEFTGKSLPQLLDAGWLDDLHPDDLPTCSSVWNTAFDTRGPFLAEFRMRRHDGVYRWMLDRGVPRFALDGTFEGYIGASFDIHDVKTLSQELAESEARFRMLADTAPVLIWMMDAAGRITYVNQQVLDFTGLPLDELLGRVVPPGIHPDDFAPNIVAFESAFLQHDPFQIRYRMRRADGVYRWMLNTARPRLSSTNTFLGYIGVRNDIHERVTAEQAQTRYAAELQAALAAAEAARDRAEEASQTKDQFLAVLSHELRTPLTPILIAASTLQTIPDLPRAARDAFEMIQRNVELESRLIADLLDLTRITRRQFSLNCEPSDLHEVIRKALEICSADAESSQHQIELDLAANASWVDGDPVRLQQVFWNVIKNAVKFTPERGHVRIVSHNTEGWIIIDIADNGVGIPPEKQAAVFDAFEQANTGSDRVLGGLGLGLTISKATVDAHGGRISITSAGLNAGTTIRVELPLLAPA